MISPARVAALRALRAVTAGRHDLGDALGLMRDHLADARDRALVTEVVTGTLRWRAAIDYQLQRVSAKGLHRLDAEVLDVLRVGAYQLMYLDRVPPRAVINDAVSLTRAEGLASAAGFVNAVLRRLDRERPHRAWPLRPTAADEPSAWVPYLSVVHSHPAWLVQRWVRRVGPARTERCLQFNNTPPDLTVVPNRLHTTRERLAARLRAEGVETTPTAVAPHGLRVTAGSLLTSAAFLGGDCLVQDEASQLLSELVGARPGHAVFDACAAPGGKTVALAADAGGRIVSADVRPRRVRLLRDTLGRAGATGVSVLRMDATSAWPFRADAFDRILVDAPCSGLGTLRREPDIRWRRQESDLPALAATQHELIRRAATHLAPGGRVIYATCSSEPDENEQVVRAFLSATPEFQLVPLDAIDGLPERIRSLATADAYLETTPDHGLEGFFGAVLQKRL